MRYPDNARSRCGYLVTFSESGLGSVQGRMPSLFGSDSFGALIKDPLPDQWLGALIAQAGSYFVWPMVRSIRIVKTSGFKDGSFAAISTTRESGKADQNIVHSLAVRIDARSLDNALADGSFTDVPLTNGFSATDPTTPRGGAGEVLSTFGFELNSADNTLENFWTGSLADGGVTTVRVGEWTTDGQRIAKQFCLSSRPAGEEYPYRDVSDR